MGLQEKCARSLHCHALKLASSTSSMLTLLPTVAAANALTPCNSMLQTVHTLLQDCRDRARDEQDAEEQGDRGPSRAAEGTAGQAAH